MSDKEAINTPGHRKGPVGLVNAYLADFRTDLDRRYGNLSTYQAYLRVALDGLVYDGARVTAADLRTTLEPFTKQDVGGFRGDQFKIFFSDLEYISLLEKGGLDGVNQRLNDLFVLLKTDLPSGEKEEVKHKLNHLLGRAVYLFPHLAGSVKVQLKPGVEQNTEKFERKYGLGYYHNRFDTLKEVYKAETGQPFSDTLVVPLPYGFSTGTHGSGQRNAAAASSLTVFFSSVSQLGKREIKEPSLAVSIERPLMSDSSTHFTLGEVEAIRFSENDKFTPYVSGNYGKYKLVERGNALTHYLTFRQFANYSNLRKREGFNVTDEEWEKCQKYLVEPEGFSNLWNYDQSTRSVSGFFAS